MPSTDKMQDPAGPALIEWVASAMCGRPVACLDCMDKAETAIMALLHAIREPTEAMLDDALRVSDDDDATSALRGIWRAMIDALRREIAE